MRAEIDSLVDVVFGTADARASAVAVADAGTSLSYADLATDVAGVATTLARAGIKPGDRVIVQFPNSVDFVRAHFGVLAAGCVSVPVDAGAPATTVTAIARDSQSAAACIFGGAPAIVAEQLTRNGVRFVQTFGENVAPQWRAEGATSRAAIRPGRGDDLACILYTTGSTGSPKGVPLRHRHVIAAIENIRQYLRYTPDDREVVILPVSHSFGLGHLYCNLRSGGAVRLEPGMAKVGRVLRQLQEFGATGFPGTPLGFGLLIDRYTDAFRELARRLRFIVINSAPLPPARAKQLRDLLPETELHVYYGLTEASRSTFICLNNVPPSHFRSVGKPMRNVDLRVEDAAGLPVPAGVSGQVSIAGPTVPEEYWNSPSETAHGFKDGRLITGDLGYVDEQGFLFLNGRLKDQINVGGLKVTPQQVEHVLEAHPSVAEAAVTGVQWPPGSEDEIVVALVVRERGTTGDIAEPLRDACRRELEPHKVPARFFAVDALPRAETGKLVRPKVRQLAERMITGAA